MIESTGSTPSTSWETVIRASDRWTDRVAPVLMFGICFIGGWIHLFGPAAHPIRADSGEVFSAWLQFTFWIVGSVLTAAAVAWQIFGYTKLSLFPDELTVCHCLGREVIFKPKPVRMSAVRDAFVEEREYRSKGGASVVRWNLRVLLDAGVNRRVAGFHNRLDADIFMARLGEVLRQSTHRRSMGAGTVANDDSALDQAET